MSDSVRPHRRQPTRLPRPWDSPGKNTGVGCHFLLQCMKVKSENEVAQSCPTLSDPMDCSPPGSSIHGIFQARVLEWVPLPSVLLQYKIKSLENERICRYTCIGIKRWLQHGNRHKGKRLQSRVYSEVSLPARGSGSAVSLLCDSR